MIYLQIFTKILFRKSRAKLLRTDFMVHVLNIKTFINLFNDLTKFDLS